MWSDYLLQKQRKAAIAFTASTKSRTLILVTCRVTASVSFPGENKQTKEVRQYIYFYFILPLSLRSRYSAASINICTIPIAAIFNNNNNIIKIRRGIPGVYPTSLRSFPGFFLSALRWFGCSVSFCFNRRGGHTFGVTVAVYHWVYLKVKGSAA